MISCTEFIPLYSEFFTYLEKKGGHDAVVRYWEYVSDNSIGDLTNPHSLASFVEKYGFEGTWRYWNHTLNEEACDIYRVYDPERKTIYNQMRHCPSKGMLLDLTHIEPYYDYCGHCNLLYSRVLDKYGIVMDMDFSEVDNARCVYTLYEKGNKFLPQDKQAGEGKLVVDLKSEDNKYLHRDFHLIGDLALTYCGEQFGDEGVNEFVTDYAQHYYSPQIADCKARGLVALKEWIEKLYEIEEASELLHIQLDGDALTVTVDKSPVIEYMHSLNQVPGKYYIEQTRTLYRAIADACGLEFNLEYYNPDGATKYSFKK